MMIPSRHLVQRLRATYREGMRVRLIFMDDPQAPLTGTEGTVVGVDDMADIMVNWDNGSHLSVIYGLDEIECI